MGQRPSTHAFKGNRLALGVCLLALCFVSPHAGPLAGQASAPRAAAGSAWQQTPGVQPPQAPLATQAATADIALGALGVHQWHLVGLRGEGVRVGIVDVGFAGYGALLGVALPPQLIARTFVHGESPTDVARGSARGVAVAEIIHRVAPEAELYLAKVATPSELAEAVAWLCQEVGAHIIHSSPLWYGLSPGDGTGALTALVEQAQTCGALWVAAAGDARLHHWSGDWRDENDDGRLEFAEAKQINWLLQDGQYHISPGMPIDVWMRWSDWESTDQDLDICLVHTGHGIPEEVACSQEEQTGLPRHRPIERLRGWTADYERAYGFYVRRVRGDRLVHMDIFVFGGSTLQHYVHGQSLGDLADAPDALTVAAVAAHVPYAQAPYSSEGPTKGPGGIATGGLPKPDLAGYAGTGTLSLGAFESTAAAAAYVAGAAALLRGAHPDWNPQAVRDLLVARAVDLGPLGWDPLYGHGRAWLGAPPLQPSVRLFLPVAGR